MAFCCYLIFFKREKSQFSANPLLPRRSLMLETNYFFCWESFLEVEHAKRWKKSCDSWAVTCKVLHIDICTLDDELLDAPGVPADGSAMQPSLSSLVSLIYFIFGFGGRVGSSLLTNCRLRGMLWCCVNCREERNSVRDWHSTQLLSP